MNLFMEKKNTYTITDLWRLNTEASEKSSSSEEQLVDGDMNLKQKEQLAGRESSSPEERAARRKKEQLAGRADQQYHLIKFIIICSILSANFVNFTGRQGLNCAV
ncbi:hypothetical protein L6452_28248 [Arctium lappa]|uniref:Uncharacterized protein n=1 Tax=Arctium lappa TaxID=4217 RepID=A0ACB8ZYR6_ARCLA|nr:hypothetical protein L6452_28248 [Arctium lappa]